MQLKTALEANLPVIWRGQSNCFPSPTGTLHASRDEDEIVRNNAVRALAVIAKSDLKAAASIPAASFVEMLNSGEWKDRNKAAMMLEFLSEGRDPQLLTR